MYQIACSGLLLFASIIFLPEVSDEFEKQLALIGLVIFPFDKSPL